MNVAKPLKCKKCVRYKFMSVSNLLFASPVTSSPTFSRKQNVLSIYIFFYPLSVQYARSMFFEAGVRWPGPL
jgi:hypothetical protein